jgi:hypothetical protein
VEKRKEAVKIIIIQEKKLTSSTKLLAIIEIYIGFFKCGKQVE